MSAKIGSLSNN